jgi:hypothetical protein
VIFSQNRNPEKKVTKNSMKKLSVILTAFSMAVAAQAQLIDDFGGDLSAYTATRILNNGSHSPTNTWQWEINGSGALQINTTSYIGIEQFALTRTDVPLGANYELTASFAAGYTGTQDIGLYVGAGHPTQDVRANYINVYRRNDGQIFTRGFDGTTELGLVGWITVTPDSMFIARTAYDSYEVGYYLGGTRNVMTTRTITSGADIGSSIGFYADVRSAGIVGSMDNLTMTLIPEPSTAALLGLFGLVSVFRLRRSR